METLPVWLALDPGGVCLLSRLHDRLAAWPWWELTALMATEMQLLFSLVTSYLAPCLRVGPFLEQVEAF